MPRLGSLVALFGAVTLLAACQVQPTVPVGTAAQLQAGLEANRPAGRGVIVVNVRGFLDQLASKRQVLATVAEVDHVVVGVKLEEGTLTKTITKAGLVGGKTTATFTGLLAGPVTVTMEAFDAGHTSLGATSQPAVIASGQNTVVDLTLQLNPTYVPPGGLGSDMDPTGEITASGTIVDGELIEGTPGASGTPTPAPTATPTPAPGATPTPPVTSGPVTITTYGLGAAPRAVALDSAGRAWVAHRATGAGLPAVSQLATSGSLLRSIAASDGPGLDPSDVAVDAAGHVWVANEGASAHDPHRGRVSKYAADGTLVFSTYVDVGLKTIALDGAGHAWVVNQRAAGAYTTESGAPMAESNTVSHLSSAGTLVGTYAFNAAVHDVAIDATGNVWVAHGTTTSGKVTKLSSAGAVLGTYALPAGTQPLGLTFDGAGYAWIAGSQGPTANGHVYKMSASGIIWGSYPVGAVPSDVAIDTAGHVWVANAGGGSVSQLTSAGTVVATHPVGGGPADLASGVSGVWTANGATTTVTRLAP